MSTEAARGRLSSPYLRESTARDGSGLDSTIPRPGSDAALPAGGRACAAEGSAKAAMNASARKAETGILKLLRIGYPFHSSPLNSIIGIHAGGRNRRAGGRPLSS